MLLGRDDETGVFQFHRAGSGGQPFPSEIPRQVAEKSAQGSLKKWTIMRIVFTNGCFDLMHVGHTRYLQAARDLGDLLVVAVNSDDSVRSLNKAPDRPIVPEAQRAEVIAALSSVNYVVLFNEPDPQSLIAALQPDVLVKGGDWALERIVGREIVEARGGVVRTIPLVPGISTTTLIQRIRSTTT